MTFYERTIALCKERCIALPEVLGQLGINQDYAYQWKRIKRSPRPVYLQKLADYFGVDPAYFIQEEDPVLEDFYDCDT
ncbi:MAG: helix-turn-helix transcriptional regulator [Oscillospiraceae bacterium]|nr:helix-turn-helix transcriptional regulator [Oscillospiraceae bacterium]